MLRLREERSRQAEVFADIGRQSFILKNELLLAGYVKHLAKTPGVSYALFADEKGIIRGHTDVRWLYKTIPDWDARSHDSDILEQSVAVPLEGGEGRALLGFQKSYQSRLMLQSVRKLAPGLLIATGGGIGLGLLLSVFLAGLMTRPLQRMAEAASRIGGGDFSAHVSIRSNRELEGLAESINAMAGRLKKLEEMKEEFIAVLSHDLRAPLAAVASYAETLRSELLGPVTDMQKEYLEIMENKTRELTGFANDILDLAKIREGRMTYDRAPFDAAETARKVLDFYRLIAEKRGTRLVLDAPGAATAFADRGKIERVLTNLVSNAMKYAPRETGLVEVSIRSRGTEVEFGIRDNGTGIPPEELGKLFHRFSRLETADHEKNKMEGVGLGLAISKTLVEDQGGRIGVESEPGKGARFFFTLPGDAGCLPKS